jgi:beta-galactosidase
VKPNFWRAPTDNDEGNNMAGRYAQWKLASLYLTAKGVGKERQAPLGTQYDNPLVTQKEDHVELVYRYRFQTTPDGECELTYRVYGDGRIQTTLSYDPVKELGDMPEFGVMFSVDADYEHVEWYGNGPAETYEDRREGAKLCIYRNLVQDNLAKYMVPQECGNKTGVRWAKVTDKKGRGLLFTGDKINFSALPYTPHEMENARHPYELPAVHHTVIRVSKQQMGVGGDDSWGALVHPEYLIDVSGKVEFTFTFRGI